MTLRRPPIALPSQVKEARRLSCTFRFKSRKDRSPISVCFHLKHSNGRCWVPHVARASGHPNLVLGADLWSYVGRWTGPHPSEQAMFVLNGEVTLELEPGRYEAFVTRGFEWEPVRQEFEAAHGRENQFEFFLQPVGLLREQGWVNGDIHLHFTRISQADSVFWRRIFEAHDLTMGNVMVYHHGTPEHETPQFAYGARGEHHHPDGVIASGEEIRDNNLFGHMTTAGIHRLIEPVSVGKLIGLRENFPYFAQMCDRVHRQGALVGFAHGGVGGTGNWVIWHSLPIEAALGKLDFLETIQMNQYVGHPYWYALLNCGIHLPCVGGSDWPWATTLADWHSGLGFDRTYVRTEGDPQDYRAWLDGIRAGRTVASNGPLLSLHANGAGPGARIDSSSGNVVLRASAWSPYPLDRLEVVCNGEVLAYRDNQGGGKAINLETRARISRDSWIAARCHGAVRPERTGTLKVWNLYAHTSPLFVRVDGAGIGDPLEALRMADSVRFIREYARTAGWWKSDRRREGYMRLCGRAIRFYEKIALQHSRRRPEAPRLR